MDALSETATQAPQRHRSTASARALFTASSFAAAEIPHRCGDESYSYYFVFRAFAPLLARWCRVHEIAHELSELKAALEAARRDGRACAHLSFLPLQHVTVAPGVPNIAFPFWEYPDIPDRDVAGNPRNNWVRVAEKLDMILTACDFTRSALVRAGVRTPIHVVPVPIVEAYFHVPDWSAGQRVVLDCPCYVLPQPRVAQSLACRLASCAVRSLTQRFWPAAHESLPIAYRPSDQLEVAGIVYTSVFNPFDLRKNWQELMVSFLRALGDCDDATLVLKLAVSRSMAREGLHNVLSFYRRLRFRHCAKLAVIAAYLTDEQMVEMSRASTFYLNASRAEGACLPLQDFLAAGRPAVAPAHTAMAEYIDDTLAFVVPAHGERTHWPCDPQRRPTTHWHVVERSALERRIRESYEMARHDAARHRRMASQARQRMREFASAQSVWPRLAEALGAVSFY
jgi:glycosyltransferase involved in cell wall biosynthesis